MKLMISMTIIEMNKCNQCKRTITQNLPLLKLKDGNWYCFSCIKFDLKNLFSQLKINSYWYSLLKPFIYNKHSKFRNKK